MKSLLILALIFACVGVLVSLLYISSRGPRVIVEATVVVPREMLGSDSMPELCRQMLALPLLRAAAKKSGVFPDGSFKYSILRQVHAEVVDEGSMKIGYVGKGAEEGRSFLREWVECFQEQRRQKIRAEDQGEATALRKKYVEEEKEVSSLEDSLRSFLTGEIGLGNVRTEEALAGLENEEDLLKVLGRERARTEKEIADSEERLKKLEVKEQSFKKALEGEDKYIVTYRVKAQNPVTVDLQQQLAEKQMNLQRLLVDSSPMHPLVRRLQEEIEKTKELLKNKEKESIREERVELNPVYGDISLELNRVERERDALEIHIGIMKEHLEREKGRLALLKTMQDKESSLVREYRGKQRVLDADRARLEKMEAKLFSEGEEGALRVKGVSVSEYSKAPLGGVLFFIISAIVGACVGMLIWGVVAFLPKSRPFNTL